jgi:hypothetical protein
MEESRQPLATIAHARSGDKGNHANIAVLAYTQTGFRWMQEHLTAEVVQRYFASLKPSRVVRYDAANVLGLNFVLYDVLAGGASRSLRVDSQGKTLALALLHVEIKPGANWKAMCRPRPKGKHKDTGGLVQEIIKETMKVFRAPPNQKRRKKYD